MGTARTLWPWSRMPDTTWATSSGWCWRGQAVRWLGAVPQLGARTACGASQSWPRWATPGCCSSPSVRLRLKRYRDWIDPASSLVISALILWSAWHLALESFNLAVDAVPRGIDPKAVRARLLTLDRVTDVHHLHIWALSTTEVALTAHLVRPCEGGEDAVLTAANDVLGRDFGIGHATLQVERGQQKLPCQKVTPTSGPVD